MKKILFVALALVFGLVSCMKDKQYPGINISNVSYSPTAVQATNDVTVSATISCFNEFTAKVVYNINGGSHEVAMTAGNPYTAIIPAQPDGTTVTFYVEASNDDVITKSASMEYTVGAVPIDYSALRLNELNGNDKFIEIFNNGAEAINMGGVTIYKDTEKLIWTGKNSIDLEPGAYLLLYSSDVINDHPEIDTTLYMFNGGLSAKKNVRIEIKTPAGVDIDDFNLVDIDQNGAAYGYSGNQAPASYSRNADTNWYYADATPGAANVDGENIVLGLEGDTPVPPTPDYTNIVLNELNGNDKFIEIYNKGDIDLAIEGWYITKDGVETEAKWTADASVIVPAHGYVLLYSANVQADHPEHPANLFFEGGLSAKKTVRIALYMNDATERDVYTRGTTGEWGQTISDVGTQSYARTPDAGDWKLAEATPGAANPATGDDIPQE